MEDGIKTNNFFINSYKEETGKPGNGTSIKETSQGKTPSEQRKAWEEGLKSAHDAIEQLKINYTYAETMTKHAVKMKMISIKNKLKSEFVGDKFVDKHVLGVLVINEEDINWLRDLLTNEKYAGKTNEERKRDLQVLSDVERELSIQKKLVAHIRKHKYSVAAWYNTWKTPYTNENAAEELEENLDLIEIVYDKNHVDMIGYRLQKSDRTIKFTPTEEPGEKLYEAVKNISKEELASLPSLNPKWLLGFWEEANNYEANKAALEAIPKSRKKTGQLKEETKKKYGELLERMISRADKINGIGLVGQNFGAKFANVKGNLKKWYKGKSKKYWDATQKPETVDLLRKLINLEIDKKTEWTEKEKEYTINALNSIMKNLKKLQ